MSGIPGRRVTVPCIPYLFASQIEGLARRVTAIPGVLLVTLAGRQGASADVIASRLCVELAIKGRNPVMVRSRVPRCSTCFVLQKFAARCQLRYKKWTLGLQCCVVSLTCQNDYNYRRCAVIIVVSLYCTCTVLEFGNHGIKPLSVCRCRENQAPKEPNLFFNALSIRSCSQESRKRTLIFLPPF